MEASHPTRSRPSGHAHLTDANLAVHIAEVSREAYPLSTHPALILGEPSRASPSSSVTALLSPAVGTTPVQSVPSTAFLSHTPVGLGSIAPIGATPVSQLTKGDEEHYKRYLVLKTVLPDLFPDVEFIPPRQRQLYAHVEQEVLSQSPLQLLETAAELAGFDLTDFRKLTIQAQVLRLSGYARSFRSTVQQSRAVASPAPIHRLDFNPPPAVMSTQTLQQQSLQSQSLNPPPPAGFTPPKRDESKYGGGDGGDGDGNGGNGGVGGNGGDGHAGGVGPDGGDGTGARPAAQRNNQTPPPAQRPPFGTSHRHRDGQSQTTQQQQVVASHPQFGHSQSMHPQGSAVQTHRYGIQPTQQTQPMQPQMPQQTYQHPSIMTLSAAPTYHATSGGYVSVPTANAAYGLHLGQAIMNQAVQSVPPLATQMQYGGHRSVSQTQLGPFGLTPHAQAGMPFGDGSGGGYAPPFGNAQGFAVNAQIPIGIPIGAGVPGRGGGIGGIPAGGGDGGGGGPPGGGGGNGPNNHPGGGQGPGAPGGGPPFGGDGGGVPYVVGGGFAGNSRPKFRTPAPFLGLSSERPREWLQEFSVFMMSQPVAPWEQVSYVGQWMSGNAVAWYLNWRQGLERAGTFENTIAQFSVAFMQTFDPAPILEDLMRQLSVLRQKPNQSISSFNQEFNRIVERLPIGTIADSALIVMYFNMIDGRVAQHLRLVGYPNLTAAQASASSTEALVKQSRPQGSQLSLPYQANRSQGFFANRNRFGNRSGQQSAVEVAEVHPGHDPVSASISEIDSIDSVADQRIQEFEASIAAIQAQKNAWSTARSRGMDTATLQRLSRDKLCFKCQQPGHLQNACPSDQANVITASPSTPPPDGADFSSAEFEFDDAEIELALTQGSVDSYFVPRAPWIREIQLGQSKAHALIDTGATLSFVSAAWCEQNSIAIQLALRSLVVRFANCTSVKCSEMVHISQVSIDDHFEVSKPFEFFVLRDKMLHQVVIGTNVLEDFDAVLHLKSRSITISPGKSTLTAELAPYVTPPVDQCTRVSQLIGASTYIEPEEQAQLFAAVLELKSLSTQSGSDDESGTRPVAQKEIHNAEVDQLRASIMSDFADRFQETLQRLPPHREGFDHTIELVHDAKPPSAGLYRHPPSAEQVMSEMIDSWLERKFISPSKSQFASAAFCVAKKDGRPRMVEDYRRLNAITLSDSHPAARIDDILDKAGGSKVYSTLDMVDGFYQLRMAKGHEHKTAFITARGLFEFNVVPMGLKNSPAALTRFMSYVFRTIDDADAREHIGVYMDDIIVFSNSAKEHFRHLRALFRALRQHDLYVKGSKCKLFCAEVDFLGHMLTQDGTTAQMDKVQAIVSWPLPKNLHQLQQFIGLASYYRCYIKDFSSIAAPLTDMLKKSATPRSIKEQDLVHKSGRLELTWSNESLASFHELKESMTSPPILAAADRSKPFEIEVDASDTGCGAVLRQRLGDDPKSKPRVIAYYSSKFNEVQSSMSAYERELYALLKSVMYMHPYIGFSKLIAYTDHDSLTYLLTQPHVHRRLDSWITRLMEMDVEVRHIRGRDNQLADYLSRVPPREHAAFVSAQLPKEFHLSSMSILDFAPDDIMDEIRSAQAEDDVCQQIRHDPRCDVNKHLHLRLDPDTDLLETHQKRIYVPSGRRLLITRLIAAAHDDSTAGHRATLATHSLLERHVWWETLAGDVEKYIQTCGTCQSNSRQVKKRFGQLVPFVSPPRPFDTINIDLITFLPATEGQHDSVLVCICHFTKYAYFIPMFISCTAIDVANRLLERVFCVHGPPATIISDRDTRFASQAFKVLTKAFGIGGSMSTARHPQTDGGAERVIRTLKEYLRKYVSQPQQLNWEELLPIAQYTYNAHRHSATGFSPAYMVFHTTPILAVDKHFLQSRDAKDMPNVTEMLRRLAETAERAVRHLQSANDRMKRYADQSRKEIEFKPGDMVQVRTDNLNLQTGSRTLTAPYIGAFPIERKIDSEGTAYQVRLSPRWHGKVHNVFHVSQLHPLKESDVELFPERKETREQDVPELRKDASEDLIVNQVLAKKGPPDQQVLRYLVTFVGRPPEECQWIPATRLRQAQREIDAYENRIRLEAKALPGSPAVPAALPRSLSQLSQPAPVAASKVKRTSRAPSAKATASKALSRSQSTVASTRMPAPSSLSQLSRPDVQLLAARDSEEEFEIDEQPRNVSHPCSSLNKKGQPCRLRTKRGDKCWTHLLMHDQLRIKPSTIPGAGLGLFAGKDFKKGDRIALYTGPMLETDKASGTYALQVVKGGPTSTPITIDGSSLKNTAGFANDCRSKDVKSKVCKGTNADFKYAAVDRECWLKASKAIKSGQEIFVPYSLGYWGPIDRQARSRKKQVIGIPQTKVMSQVMTKVNKSKSHSAKAQLTEVEASTKEESKEDLESEETKEVEYSLDPFLGGQSIDQCQLFVPMFHTHQ